MGVDPIVDAEQLGRTDDGGRSVDAWERVQEYREAMRYRSKHPNKGSSAMASALEMPRGRIRSWVNGSKTDAVNAIEIDGHRNWIETGPGEPTFEALNALVANVFSAGSITEDSYRPAFALDDDRRQLHILVALDVGLLG